MAYYKILFGVVFLFAFAFNIAYGSDSPESGISYTVIVLDSMQLLPMQLVRISLRRDGVLIAGKVTDPSGRAQFSDISPGKYVVTVRFVGYVDQTHSIVLRTSQLVDSIFLSEVKHDDLVVSGGREGSITSVDLKTGAQVFESETYHPSPVARISGLVQENMTGAARASTGEVHIRGQHGEFTYYVDGIPIPLGVFGGLNEVVDPKVIDRATFLTGGFPAEYGGQLAAVIDVQNKVPSGHAHLDGSGYVGSYLGMNNASPDSLGIHPARLQPTDANGQSLSFSDHFGKIGVFVSGSRQETDRRIDSPLPNIYHNHGLDYFLYGKFDCLISDIDYLSVNLNYGKTLTQIPFDPLVEGMKDDGQNTMNAFQTISYFRNLSQQADHESNLFIGGYGREGSLLFTPGDQDSHNFQFANDSLHNYILTEDRSFTTVGVRSKYDLRLSHVFRIMTGLNFSTTSGTENFTTKDTLRIAGPSIKTNYSGSDFGIFLQSEIHPLEWTRFEAGIRYDQHIAPDAPMQKQISPRIKWSFLFDDNSTAYLYYGNLFMPNNIEGLRSIASNVADNSALPTLPERDDFYEVAFLYNFDVGLKSKLCFFRKVALPGVDDQTIGSSSIKTPVNIAKVRTDGLEFGLSFSDPSTPFSGYANLSLVHAYGSGAISGGFLKIDDAGAATDLDHDQRLSSVIAIKYQSQNWFTDLTAIYGSGLTNGNPDGVSYQTGLFNFNTRAHTTPSWILNFSTGYTIQLGGGANIEPSLYINNLFDHGHLIKGAFFSGASWEEPRCVVFKLGVHI